MKYKLKELVNIKYGKNQKNVECVNGKYPILGTGGIIGFANKYLYNDESILIGRKGTIDQIKYIDKPFWTIDTLFYTEINKDIVYPKYLYYKLKKIDFKMYSEGTTIPSLRTQTLNEIEIDIDTKRTQKKIVNILSNIDKKIELLSHTNNNLYEIIKVQYENFMEELTEYEIVKLKDIAIISSGKRPKVKGNEYKVPLIGASGVMSYTDIDNYNEDIIIIGRVGTLGVVQRYFDKIWASDNTLTIKTDYKNTMESYLKTVDYIALNRGSTQPLITQTDISNLEIKFNKSKFIQFENAIKIIREKIYQNEKENQNLEQLRDTLLPKLMNGEIDLDKIEI